MNCLFCSNGCGKDAKEIDKDRAVRSVESSEFRSRSSSMSTKSKENGTQKSCARSFTFRELAAATKNFKEINLIGEGGFGKVYKGLLESEQVVAVKQLNLNGLQGTQEFMMEVLMLSMLHHPNLVTLKGYCIDGDQKLLVYEYMEQGNLEEHLFDIRPDTAPLSWGTRMKIAAGAARGLEYLHCRASPPVIYRDLKSANILLDSNFNPKLSDFGLAKLAPVGKNTHVSTRVMGTYGYCAPEYAMSGKLTLKSDIYSFGVVLMELITGRKAIDRTKQPPEQNLITWVRPLMKDKNKFIQLVDPSLQGRCSPRSLQHTIAVAGMCLQEHANFRPLIGDIVVALEYLASQTNKESQSGVVRSTPSASPLHRRSRDRSSRERNSSTLSSYDEFGVSENCYLKDSNICAIRK